jgi:3'(2'), 5'-bisphosphate nucleotidase
MLCRPIAKSATYELRSALKFGLLAEGLGRYLSATAPTWAWEVAAGHAVLGRAGGSMLAPNGEPLRYGSRDS